MVYIANLRGDYHVGTAENGNTDEDGLPTAGGQYDVVDDADDVYLSFFTIPQRAGRVLGDL